MPYRPALADPAKRAFQKTPKGIAFLDVLDFRDVGRELRDGTKQFGRKLVGKDLEKPQEEDHHERVFGRSRMLGRKQAVLEEEKEELETGLLRAKEQGTKEEDFDDHAAPWANTATAFSPSMDSPGLLHHQYQQVLGKEDYERMIPKSSTGVLYPIPSPSLDTGNQRIKFSAPDMDAGDTVYSPSRWRNRIFGSRGGRTQVPTTGPPDIVAVVPQRYDYISPSIHNSAHTSPNSHVSSPPNQQSRSAYGPPAPKNGLRMPDPLSPSRYPGFNEQAHVDRMYAVHALAESVTNTPALPSRASYSSGSAAGSRRMSSPAYSSYSGGIPYGRESVAQVPLHPGYRPRYSDPYASSTTGLGLRMSPAPTEPPAPLAQKGSRFVFDEY